MEMIVFKYDKRWKRKASVIKKRDDYLCQVCKRNNKTTEGTHVHHISPVETNPDLAMENNNLITLCNDCHEKMHNRTTGQLTKLGYLLKKWKDQEVEVINVFGPPCSGKSTYVEQQAGRNDLIFDWDKIVYALTNNEMHDNNPHTMELVLHVRTLIMHDLETNNNFDKAFIISIYPLDLGAYYHAKHVKMDTSLEVCIERSKNRPDPEKTQEIIFNFFGMEKHPPYVD